ncbi:MAG: beta-glucosidase, partial [Sphingobacterium sp.]
MKLRILLLTTLSTLIYPQLHAQQLPYKDSRLATEQRVNDLLGRMTVEEKVGQLSKLLGWEMYEKKGKHVGVSDKFKKAVKEQHIGLLWATLRADPWTQKTLLNG